MYTYKNKVTGVTVTTYGKVNGANWVQVKDSKTKEPAKSEEKEQGVE